MVTPRHLASASALRQHLTPDASGVELTKGATHLLEISFDHHARGLSKDFRPALPLIFHFHY